MRLFLSFFLPVIYRSVFSFHVHTYAELDRVSVSCYPFYNYGNANVGLLQWSIISSLATSTTIDFAIAAAMCFYLRKSKGDEQRLNTRISRVMQYTLNSGLLTSACSLSALFTVCRCFLPHRSDFAHVANVLMLESVCSLAQHIRVRRSRVFVDPTCVHSSPSYYLPTQIRCLYAVYAGSFLAMLNARERKLPSPPDSDAEKGQNQATLTGGNQIQCISCKRQSGGSRASISTARLSPPPISTKATMGNMKEGMMSDATVVNTPHSRVESGSPSSFSKGKGVEAFGKASAKERGLVKSKLHVDVGGKYGAAKGRAMIVTTGSIEESPTGSEIMEPSAALVCVFKRLFFFVGELLILVPGFSRSEAHPHQRARFHHRGQERRSYQVRIRIRTRRDFHHLALPMMNPADTHTHEMSARIRRPHWYKTPPHRSSSPRPHLQYLHILVQAHGDTDTDTAG